MDPGLRNGVKGVIAESRGVIVKLYKGPLRPGMSIDFYGGGVCYDAPHNVGAVHVVYARRQSDGRYSTDCTRTHLIGESTRDIEFLERFSSLPWLAALLEPLGCNERRLPSWLRRIWIWNLQRPTETFSGLAPHAL